VITIILPLYTTRRLGTSFHTLGDLVCMISGPCDSILMHLTFHCNCNGYSFTRWYASHFLPRIHPCVHARHSACATPALMKSSPSKSISIFSIFQFNASHTGFFFLLSPVLFSGDADGGQIC